MKNSEYQIQSIPNWPGYLADTLGQIWSDKLGYRKLVAQRTHSRFGHKSVHLSKPGEGAYREMVHRLILITFVGPAPPSMECRHLDGCASNNYLTNLKWGTREEQHEDRRKHGTDPGGERNGRAILTRQEVLAIRSDHAAGIMPMALIQKYGYKRHTIERLIYGSGWKSASLTELS